MPTGLVRVTHTVLVFCECKVRTRWVGCEGGSGSERPEDRSGKRWGLRPMAEARAPGPVIALWGSTMFAHIPSLATLESGDDRQLAADLGLVRVRSQVGAIRTLVDRADELAQPGATGELSEELIEEMARLGCRLLEAAASLAESRRTGESGAFSRMA